MNHFQCLLVLFLLFLLNACSFPVEKDITYIRKNFESYDVKTYPYAGKIQFSLSSELLQEQQNTPIEITSIHNTDVVVSEILERENSLNGDLEIILTIGLDGIYQSPRGKMVSLFHLDTEAGTYTTGDVVLEAYNEDGVNINFGTGMGDHIGKYEQLVQYIIKKEDLAKGKEWTFQISGLNILEYVE